MRLEQFRAEPAPEVKLDTLRTLAASLPVIDPQSTRGRETHEEFGGEFYRHLAEINRVRVGQGTDAEVFYVRMVKERFGYDLVDFYDRNHGLCEEICDAIADQEPYDMLVSGYVDICRDEAEGLLLPGSAQTVRTSINHPAGIEAVAMYYWDRLNPLLEQAYGLIDQEILNAPFLTK